MNFGKQLVRNIYYLQIFIIFFSNLYIIFSIDKVPLPSSDKIKKTLYSSIAPRLNSNTNTFLLEKKQFDSDTDFDYDTSSTISTDEYEEESVYSTQTKDLKKGIEVVNEEEDKKIKNRDFLTRKSLNFNENLSDEENFDEYLSENKNNSLAKTNKVFMDPILENQSQLFLSHINDKSTQSDDDYLSFEDSASENDLDLSTNKHKNLVINKQKNQVQNILSLRDEHGNIIREDSIEIQSHKSEFIEKDIQNLSLVSNDISINLTKINDETPTNQRISNENSFIKSSLKKTFSSSKKRVSFGNLSPIHLEKGNETNLLSSKNSSMSSIKNTEEDEVEQEDEEEDEETSRLVSQNQSSPLSQSSPVDSSVDSSINNSTKNSSKSFIQRLNEEDEESMVRDDEVVQFDNNEDYGDFDYQDQHVEEDDDDRTVETPIKKSSNKPLDTPSSYSYISTPGSAEFPTAIKVLDKTYLPSANDDNEENLDEETDREGETDNSFLNSNKSYLFTIDDQNEKYAGEKVRKETKQMKLMEKQTALKNKKMKKFNELKRLNEFNDNFIDQHDEEKKFKEMLENDEEWIEKIDSDNDEDDYENNGHLRRSKRATKGRRFAFWKGERPLYEQGTMVGILHSAPTPVKKKRNASTANKTENNKRKKMPAKNDYNDEDEEVNFDTDYPINSGYHEVQTEEAAISPSKKYVNLTSNKSPLKVWNFLTEKYEDKNVIVQNKFLTNKRKLQPSALRPNNFPPAEAYASLFHESKELKNYFPKWLTGSLIIPKNSRKDPDCVGESTHLHFVSHCPCINGLELILESPPDNSKKSEEDLENNLWDESNVQRILLNEGDFFYLPPGSVYRLENLSKHHDIKIHWVIIQPYEEPEYEAGSSVSNQTIST